MSRQGHASIGARPLPPLGPVWAQTITKTVAKFEILADMSMDDAIAKAREAAASRQSDERAAEEQRKVDLDTALRVAHDIVIEAVQRLTTAGVAPTLVQVEGSGGMLSSFRVIREGWPVRHPWALTRDRQLCRVESGLQRETGSHTSAGSTHPRAIAYNRRLRQFLAVSATPVVFGDPAEVHLGMPEYESSTRGLFFAEGRLFLDSSTFVFEEAVADALVALGV